MDNNALLVIDVQKGFINRYTEHIPAAIERILPAYRHVIATRFFNPDSSSYRRLMNWERFSRGTEDTDLAFNPGSYAIVIEKTGYTCVDQELLRLLDVLRIEEVHVVGIDTDVCVLKCAADLFDAGRTPVVLAACCASHAGIEFHDSGIKIISRFIGARQVIK